MRLRRVLGAAAALLVVPLVAVPATAASATAAPLPAATDVLPVPAQTTVELAAVSGVTDPAAVKATLRWVIPACTGTVRASFSLTQDGYDGVVHYFSGKVDHDYPCTAARQGVTVTYGPVSVSGGPLHEGPVAAAVTTYVPLGTGGPPARTATSHLKAVATGTPAAAASTVLPAPVVGSTVVVYTDAVSGVSEGSLRLKVPACTGTVHAHVALVQDGSVVAAQGPGTADLPCSPGYQLFTVTLPLGGAGAPAPHAGPADVRVDTYWYSHASVAGLTPRQTGTTTSQVDVRP